MPNLFHMDIKNPLMVHSSVDLQKCLLSNASVVKTMVILLNCKHSVPPDTHWLQWHSLWSEKSKSIQITRIFNKGILNKIALSNLIPHPGKLSFPLRILLRNLLIP